MKPRHALWMVLGMAGLAARAAQAYFGAAYWSPQSQHILYDVGKSHATTSNMELRVEGPNANEVWGTGTTNVVGTNRLETTAAGENRFILKESYWEAGENIVEERQVDVLVKATNVAGTLYFDERIELGTGAWFSGNTLTVNGKRTLTIENTIDPVHGLGVRLDGTLILDNCGFQGMNLDTSGGGERTIVAANCRFIGEVLTLNQLVTATFTTCFFPTTVHLMANHLVANDCLFVKYTSPSAPDGQVTFGVGSSYDVGQCEFRTKPVALHPGSAVGSVHDCAFVGGGLAISGSNAAPPTIVNNSFYSTTVVAENPALAVSLDGNYWGGRFGYEGIDCGWLDDVGSGSPLGSSNTVYLQVGNDRVSTVGAERPLPLVFASIRYGCVVLGGWEQIPARSNRECLVACELLFPGEGLEGALFELRCDGQTYPPRNPGFIPRQNYKGDLNPDRRTLNFILPAHFAPGTNRLELWMDASGAVGWTNNTIWGSKIFRIDEFSVLQDPEPARPLRIGVVAASILVDGYVQNTDPGNRQRGRPASIHRVVQRLREDLATHWPLNDDEIEIVNLGTYNYEGGWLTSWLPQVSSVGMMYSLALELNSFLNEYNAGQKNGPLDALVCVVPGTSLGAANEGASLRGLRRIALVDEGSPGAALHELGHACGLYTGTEQYDLPSGFDGQGNVIVTQRGARLHEVTIFNSAPRHCPAALGGATIRHFPYGSVEEVYDFMGAKEPHWSVPSSYRDIRNHLRGLLGSKGVSKVADPAPKDGADGWPLQINALFRQYWNEERGEWDTEIAPGSLQISAGAGAGWEPTVNEGTFLNVANQCLDARGNYVTGFTARAETWPVDDSQWNLWHEIRRMPPEVEICRVAHVDAHGNPLEWLAVQTPGPLPEPSLSAAVAGTGTGQTVVVSWNLGPATNLGPRLDRNLYFSTNGTDWMDLRAPALTNRLSAPPEFFNNPAQLWFRLAVSDGFGERVAAAGPLAFQTQPPLLAIHAPRDGDVAPTGTLWRLAAVCDDLRDGAVSNVAWHSSLAGPLGTGPTLADVELAAGTHLLTCTATSRAGLSATGSVSVTVRAGAPADGDLSIASNAFACLPAGGDPAGDGSLARLVPGKTNFLTVSFRNQGLVQTAGVAIAVSEAGGPFVELFATSAVWDVFEEHVWSAPYVPTSRQPHAVRAQFQSLEWPDPNPADNVRTWTMSNLPPAARGARIEIRQDDLPLANRLWAYDPNGDALSYSLVSPPAAGTVELDGSNFTYAVETNWKGTATFQFTASDGLATSTPATVTLAVLPRRKAPVLTSPLTATGTQGQPFAYGIAATNDPAQFTATPLPDGLLLDAVAGWIEGVPTVTGTRNVTIGALNVAGSTTATLSVYFAPGRPVVTSAASAAQVVGQPFAYRITASNDPTGFTASGLPAGLVVDSATGWITGICHVAGTTEALVSATNVYGTGGLWLQIHVVPAAVSNDYFDLRSILSGTNVAFGGTTADATRETGEPPHAGSFSCAGSLWWTWIAPRDGFVTVSTESFDFDTLLAVYVGDALNGLTCVVSNNNWRWLSHSLVYFQAASGTVYQIALDGDNGRGAFDLHLEYRAKPLIVSPMNFEGIAGQPFHAQIEAVNGPTSFGATDLPAGLGVVPATGVVTGAPAAKTGQFVYLLAANVHGVYTSQVWYTIYSAQYPVFTHAPHVAGVAQSNFAFQLQATHAQAGTYDAQPLPFGLSINPNDGWITGVPGQAGVFRIPIYVRNSLEELATNTLVMNLRLPYNEWQFYHFTAPEIADPDFSGPDADADGDGASNDAERWCGTNPRDPGSVLALEGFAPAAGAAHALQWQSMDGHFYRIGAAPAVTGLYVLVTNQIPATAPQNTWTDDGDRGPRSIYRIELEP